jgi:RimJ/RimL family protein N-acetyltransferase
MGPFFNLQPTQLEDNLLRLVPLSQTSFDSLFELASDPLIWEQHPDKNRYQKEVFQKYFDGAVASKGAFLVFDKTSNPLIGCTRYYDYSPALSRVAIGYTFLARNYWGGPYNKAMKKLMLDYAFQYVNSVVFHIGSENIRSQKAVMKLGAKKIRDFDFSGSGTITHEEYEILRPEWQNNSR